MINTEHDDGRRRQHQQWRRRRRRRLRRRRRPRDDEQTTATTTPATTTTRIDNVGPKSTDNVYYKDDRASLARFTDQIHFRIMPSLPTCVVQVHVWFMQTLQNSCPTSTLGWCQQCCSLAIVRVCNCGPNPPPMMPTHVAQHWTNSTHIIFSKAWPSPPSDNENRAELGRWCPRFVRVCDKFCDSNFTPDQR